MTLKMRKNSPAHKQSTLASTTQTKLKSQDEIVGKLTAEITNLEKAVERLQNELLITKPAHDVTNPFDGLHQYQRR